MKSKKLWTFVGIGIFAFLISGFLFFGNSILGFHNLTGESVYEGRDLPGDLEQKIQEAKEKGNYDCCLDPPCTMCYMGSWIFEEGECYCDGAMKEGDWDKVCPECKKGLEEGRCKNSQKDSCEVNYKDSKK